MTEYGIWSDLAGGLIDGQMSKESADKERLRLITEDGEEADDLKVVELCEYHEEQCKDGCEECAAEWADSDEEADDEDEYDEN